MASPSRRSAGGTRGLDYGDDDDNYIDDCDSKEYSNEYDCENYENSKVIYSYSIKYKVSSIYPGKDVEPPPATATTVKPPPPGNGRRNLFMTPL